MVQTSVFHSGSILEFLLFLNQYAERRNQTISALRAEPIASSISLLPLPLALNTHYILQSPRQM